MTKEVLGHVDCPVCGNPHAEVKNDRNTKPFIFCPDRNCATQVFTRREFQVKSLLARMRPVTVTVTEKPAPQNPVQEPKQEPAPPKKKPSFADALLSLTGGAQ